MELIVDLSGTIRCIYSEELFLDRLGKLAISRGSYVEPTPDGRWTADLSPVGGPVLGPFACRSDALAAEYRWLEEHWLIKGPKVANAFRLNSLLRNQP